MLAIFSPGQKRFFFRRFSPFFGHVAPAMLLQKRENRRKKPSFLPPAENPQHVLKTTKLQNQF